MLELWLDFESGFDGECVGVRRMWIESRGEGGVGIKYSWSASMVGAEARLVTKRTFCQGHCSSSWLETLIDNGNSGTLIRHSRERILRHERS